jgi:YHS domain-containing protein
VLSFLFADLIVLPIILIYRKYYGWSFTVRITALMFVTMVLAALAVGGLFNVLGAAPSGPRPTRAEIFGAVHVDYMLVLNLIAFAAFATLFWLTRRRGATDPVCGMTVDRSRAITKTVAGRTFYFCSEHCMNAFEADGGDPSTRSHPRRSNGEAVSSSGRNARRDHRARA